MKQSMRSYAHDSTSFFYPDYTVGTGISPVHANKARGLRRCVTTGRELELASPCPEGTYGIVTYSILIRDTHCKAYEKSSQSVWRRPASTDVLMTQGWHLATAEKLGHIRPNRDHEPCNATKHSKKPNNLWNPAEDS